MKPKIILTFDLEEFDLPLEFDCLISEDNQFKITNEGLKKLIELLDFRNIKATFFTTGNFCEKFPETIKSLSEKHEIGSHAYYHSQFEEEYLIKSKKIIESISGKKIMGFRMPLLQITDKNLLEQAGYKYDSSINPTFIPGRYNHFMSQREPYRIANSLITEFPVSVSPIFRIPLFWLSFKNMPFSVYKLLCNWTINKDNFLHLYFHPWEFATLNEFKIPSYIKNPNGEKYSKKFDQLLAFLKSKGEFVTASEFLRLDKL